MEEAFTIPEQALENRPSGDLSISRVSNCVVTRSSLVVTAGGVHSAALFEGFGLRRRFEMNVVGFGSIVKHGLSRMPGSDSFFHVFNIWGNGYHHWLTEVAPKFFLFEDEIRNGKVILPVRCPAFVSEFMELFSFDNGVQLSGNTFFKKLNVVSNPNSGHFSLRHLTGFRSRVLRQLSSPRGQSGRKIYVSRQNARARKVMNEVEVMGILKSRGFECIETDSMLFADQVQLFSECDTLISIHGAALTNMLFMPPGSKIFEIYPAGFTKRDFFNACFRHLADVLALKHKFLFFERQNTARKFSLDTDNVVVDLEDLDRRLSGDF